MHSRLLPVQEKDSFIEDNAPPNLHKERHSSRTIGIKDTNQKLKKRLVSFFNEDKYCIFKRSLV